MTVVAGTDTFNKSMEKLNEYQKKLLVEYMNDHDGYSFAQHAAWATHIFHVAITEVECNKLFMDSMFR